MTRILGMEHPDTITAMGNIAVTYQCLGKYTEAEKLEIQVLDARNKILGVEHPNTIKALENLAAIYNNLERHTEAEKLNIQVLDARNRILGVEHPETIWAREIIAATYHNLGRYAGRETGNRNSGGNKVHCQCTPADSNFQYNNPLRDCTHCSRTDTTFMIEETTQLHPNPGYWKGSTTSGPYGCTLDKRYVTIFDSGLISTLMLVTSGLVMIVFSSLTDVKK